MLDGSNMDAHQIHNRLHGFLETLDRCNCEDQKDAIMNEVMETGGTYVPHSDGADNWASHLFELNLHGVEAYGHSETDVITNWKPIAARILRGGCDAL
jgi:hypothetical protein